MKLNIIRLICLVLCTGLSTVAIALDIYPFQSPEQETRFVQLTHTFRCLVCQGEDLDASQAPLARDLKHEIYQRIQTGQSDQDIRRYLISRYGDSIVENPALSAKTGLLWIGPFVLLGAGVLVIQRLLRQQ